MHQKLSLIGHLGRAPEMHYAPDGAAVTTFSLATNRRWNNPDGSVGEETTWFQVSCWRKQAEAAYQYLKKGSKVLVEGRLKPDKETGGPRIWMGDDGKPHAAFEVTADLVRFLDGADSGNGRGGEAEGHESSEAGLADPSPDSELPF